MNSLLRRLRRQRIDGRSDDETMQGAANVIEALEAQIAERDDELAALRERVAELEGKVTAIVGWLEREQPDVFRRGLWDALREVPSAGGG